MNRPLVAGAALALVLILAAALLRGPADAPAPASGSRVDELAADAGPAAPTPGAESGPAPRGAVADSPRLLDALGRLQSASSGPSDAQRRIAADFAALFNAWDEAAYEDMFSRPSARRALALQERVEWFRERVGSCRLEAPLDVRDELNARFLYACERGRLEAEFRLDDASGEVFGLMFGARDIDPPDEVKQAAGRVVTLMRRWDDALFAATFAATRDRAATRRAFADGTAQRGRCSLGAPALVSARGGLFALDCERGEHRMKIELDDDDRVAQFSVGPRPEQAAR